jgi:hypothetical protein
MAALKNRERGKRAAFRSNIFRAFDRNAARSRDSSEPMRFTDSNLRYDIVPYYPLCLAREQRKTSIKAVANSVTVYTQFLFQFTDLPPARVVFAVNLEGSARKVITVRSALQVVNKLDERVILRLDHVEPMAGGTRYLNFVENLGKYIVGPKEK